jgi:hypothetical protein
MGGMRAFLHVAKQGPCQRDGSKKLKKMRGLADESWTEVFRERTVEDPSSKHQAPEKLQTSSSREAPNVKQEVSKVRDGERGRGRIYS